MAQTKQTTNPSRLPPQNVEAEQSVLGALMLDKDAIIKIADLLKPDDFYKGVHQIIFSAMLDLFDKNEPIDLLSLDNCLKHKKQLKEVGGNSYLTELVNSIPTAAHVLHYAKIIKNKKVLRDLINHSHQIIEASYQEPDDTENLVDEAEQKIFNISQKATSQRFIQVKETLEDAFERIDKLHRGEAPTRGVPTGFLDLDNIISGLQPADLVILAARPSLGKTTLALDFARHISTKEKKPVAIFSLEMSKEQLVDRLICSQAGVDSWRMRTGHLSGEEDFQRIQKALDDLSATPIFIEDSPSPTIMQMRTMARRLESQNEIGLIVIDYLQLIQPRNGYDSPVQQVTEISRNLKALARELNVPVLALSQLSRAVENRSPAIPKLSDLRESGCLNANTIITCAKTGKRYKIKDLAQKKEQKPIKILGVDENYKLSPHWMTKVFYSGKKDVYQIKTRSGRIIKASGNHPFLQINGWVNLEDLKIGETIALPRKIDINPKTNSLSYNELTLLGHLLGDGCILPNQPYHYTSADKINLNTVKRTAAKLFKIKARIVKQGNWSHVYLPSPYHLTHKIYHPITNWFKKLEIKPCHSWKKEIPNKVFECNDKRIAFFLKHIWATDGNLSWKKLKNRKPLGNIYYASSSKKLAQGIQHLLLRLNIQSTLSCLKSKKGYRDMYHLSIQGSINQLKFLKKIGIADKRAKIIPQMIKALKQIAPNPNNDAIPKQAWAEIITPIKQDIEMTWRDFSQGIETAYCGSTLFKHGISRNRMMRIYKILKNKKIKNLAESDIYWDKIVSIKKIGQQHVYDATVPGVHNFVADDFIVHNSLEQDSDVVMFIYREDKDRINTEKKNIAEIIVAKHRNGPTGRAELFFNESQVSFKNLERHLEE